ncbi:MAG TPA: SDR family oxidoreductase [Phycisphaerae bacterium]|nr:SDR family oxidoreductase [Phycisphaerae bacterium]HOQ85748.1 SDR family oxidoreductase [Phycisphaerae bacterium]HPU27263.1 SDR family oxidoreductase [Phycisphaerae bacterium]HQE26947.1 SDR family oxidoreductase [Phycisphaerae bacterium]
MDTLGKVALVTGAARRVGRAIALELARAGCDVAVHYRRSADAAAEVAEEVRRLGRRVCLVSGDLGDAATPERLVEEVAAALGGLGILVNNASVFDAAKFDDWSDSHWEQIFRVNLFAPAMAARAAARFMRRGGGGRIVNLTDILAERPIKGFAAYCASKAALISLTRSLARELAPDITVNAISPGIAVFPDDYDVELREKLTKRVPLGRPGTPEEVAAAVRFLVTSGDYITGTVLTLDGGRSIVP